MDYRRIDHAGRKGAEAERPAFCSFYHDLLVRQFETISVASNDVQVLERFVAEARHPKPLHVLDENARLAGRIEASDAAHPHALRRY